MIGLRAILLVGLMCLGAGAAQAATVTTLKMPVETALKADSIVCTHPESLYLIYEGSSIALVGGGSEAFQAYFTAAGKVFEARSECLVQSESISVNVEAYATLNNPLKAEPVVYGRFGVKGSDNKVWATIGNLPAFEAEGLRTGLVKRATPQAATTK
ncbi:hypothetical protein [Pseudomonas putida]|uniref:hypothetical protein n=1 Tax=Pseudomonas putida TaxID=303 RepID=UPI003812D6CF